MKTIISLTLAGLLATSLVCTGDLAEKRSEKAKAIIAADVEVQKSKAEALDDTRSAPEEEVYQASR